MSRQYIRTLEVDLNTICEVKTEKKDIARNRNEYIEELTEEMMEALLTTKESLENIISIFVEKNNRSYNKNLTDLHEVYSEVKKYVIKDINTYIKDGFEIVQNKEIKINVNENLEKYKLIDTTEKRYSLVTKTTVALEKEDEIVLYVLMYRDIEIKDSIVTEVYKTIINENYLSKKITVKIRNIKTKENLTLTLKNSKTVRNEDFEKKLINFMRVKLEKVIAVKTVSKKCSSCRFRKICNSKEDIAKSKKDRALKEIKVWRRKNAF